MQRRLRQAVTAVREHGASSYASAAAAGGFRSVDVIFTRATPPNDMPLHEKHVRELLKAFAVSGQASLRRFSLSFTRRFGRTNSWRVALKCLLLLHRLLRSTAATEIGASFRSELIWSRTNGLISLHPCRFRDESSSSSGDYTAFVRSYARFLDEALIICDDKPAEERETTSFPEKMKEAERALELLPQLQSLIDRAMECRPAGSPARSFVVGEAMKTILRESFRCYGVFRREFDVVLDTLFEMPYGNGVKAFGAYKRASVQADELSEFYGWCKEMGFCGFYEYPFVVRIPALQLLALEGLFAGMWRFTDSSESSSAGEESRSSVTEDDGDRKVVGSGGHGFEEPLIHLEDESWEALLEASIYMENGCCDQTTAFYNPNGENPFDQTWTVQEQNHGYHGYVW